MSFILDALKKSETDRQRQSGPALFEVKVAPPRNGLPLWAVGLAVLLAVNLVIVAWVLLRRPAAPADQADAPPAMAQTGNPGSATSGFPGSQPAPQGQTLGSPGGPAAPASGAAPAPPLAQTAGMTQAPPAGGGASAPPFSAQSGASSSPQQPFAAPTAGTAETSGAQPEAAGEKLNPDDYAPAADPAPPAPFGNRVSRGTSSGVPLYQDAALNSHLPNLRLDLHVYAAVPKDRFVMINMHKLHEGDSLPEGVRVESITPDGAVLSQNGAKFLLPRE